MKVLFDQGTPVPLRRYLPDHTITTAYEQGWASLKNGQLLAEAELAGIDIASSAPASRAQQRLVHGRRWRGHDLGASLARGCRSTAGGDCSNLPAAPVKAGVGRQPITPATIFLAPSPRSPNG
ncbi:hypothetical protein EYB53_017180 [Candidatus Chloroploca sp. M-50]|uniref:Uncharacterized protein n=1 Tax=Candidatus Chloroploca mongolica TaxID=2528176 RepID=A0ABS4DDC0_9CHLR|nr:hypothetical protein [Candidatus Chloroploca mongolica]MBP1467450.1 hypothetical protein [Candidatus Chloroploca mongolica]